MSESFRRWEPVVGIASPCGDVRISNHGDALQLLLKFSVINGGIDRDLRLVFPWGHVVGFASWDEFAHPWNTQSILDALPTLGVEPWPKYAFPTLEVLGSTLVAAFDEGQRAMYTDVRHFRIVTLDHTVDVLATSEPRAEWIRPEAIEPDPKEVDWLLRDLCTRLGFSMAVRDAERFIGLVHQGPDSFADAVLLAEGLDPVLEKRLWRDVRDFVATRFERWASRHER